MLKNPVINILCMTDIILVNCFRVYDINPIVHNGTGKFYVVGEAGLEPATSRTPSVCANRAAPLPEQYCMNVKVLITFVRLYLKFCSGVPEIGRDFKKQVCKGNFFLKSTDWNFMRILFLSLIAYLLSLLNNNYFCN